MDKDLYEEWFELESYHWWFVGRRQLFVKLIEDALCAHPLRQDGPFWVADMGCGTGVNLDALSRFGPVVGVDVANTALAFCKERKPYCLCQAPFSHLPFRSGSIQLLTGFDVLEHGEDDRAMLTEAFRVCAPGGWAVFSVPAYHFMWGDHDVAAHHYRRYGAAEIQEKVQEIGFQIHRLTYLNTFLFPISIVFRQSKNLMTGLLRRLGRPIKARSDFRSTAPPVLNEVMLRVFSAEYLLLKRRDLPFGLSIFCIARKA